MEPEELESLVQDTLSQIFEEVGIESEIADLQCFSPAYPEPPHIIRETVE